MSQLFEQSYNTFLSYTLLEKSYQEKCHKGRKAKDNTEMITNNLEMISNLYLYRNTPPHAYRTQASKVAETVRRAYMFNKRKN
jgi:hypothetical protein